MLDNAIALGDFEVAQDVPMELTDQECLDYSNECRNQSRRAAMLETHCGQAYSLILGQCTQLLQDKMKQDASWSTVSASYDPLELYKLIERVILKQTRQSAEEQYLAYLFLVNSGAQHDLLRKELQNDFTKGSDKYPENCPQALLFLDRYSKSSPADGGSQGTAFAQKGGRPKKGGD